jgi:hypothetical protein
MLAGKFSIRPNSKNWEKDFEWLPSVGTREFKLIFKERSKLKIIFIATKETTNHEYIFNPMK